MPFAGAWAQQKFVDQLVKPEEGQGKVRLIQDAEITRLVNGTKAATSAAKGTQAAGAKDSAADAEAPFTAVKPPRKMKAVGYRIQVFSDRNQRTAKGEALSKERNIKASFPDMGTYISYDAPSWRLRVGDFRTREEAKVQLDELRELFPGYANEMIIVVDVINTAQ